MRLRVGTSGVGGTMADDKGKRYVLCMYPSLFRSTETYETLFFGTFGKKNLFRKIKVLAQTKIDLRLRAARSWANRIRGTMEAINVVERGWLQNLGLSKRMGSLFLAYKAQLFRVQFFAFIHVLLSMPLFEKTQGKARPLVKRCFHVWVFLEPIIPVSSL